MVETVFSSNECKFTIYNVNYLCKGSTVEKGLIIFRARTYQTKNRFYTVELADFSSAQSCVGGLHSTPPSSLVTGERRQRLTTAQPERRTTSRGWSQGDRGLPEMRLEAVYQNCVWCAADVHDKILHARYPDAVRPQ
jgi:hypothetical protein